MPYRGGFTEAGGVSSLLSARDLNRTRFLGVNEVAALVIIFYLILGVVFFSFGEGMDAGDSLYLSIQTLLTIGYGDVQIKDKSFQIFYMLLGAGLCLAFFGILTGNIMEVAEEAERKRLAKVTSALHHALFPSASPSGQHPPGLKDDDEGGGGGAKAQAVSVNVNLDAVDEELHVLRHQGLTLSLHMLLVLLAGAGIMARIEGWSFNDGLYWATSTITSVGYGDISPLTSNGRWFFVFYAPLGCAIVAKGFADLVRLPLLLRQKATEAKIMEQFKLGLSERVLSSILSDTTLSRVPQLQKDPRQLQKSEFVLMLLLIMDKVKVHDLMLASSLFSRLDILGQGSLSFAALEQELQRAREREEAAREEEDRLRVGSVAQGFESMVLGGGRVLESGLGGLARGLERFTGVGVGVGGGVVGGGGGGGGGGGATSQSRKVAVPTSEIGAAVSSPLHQQA